MPRKKGQFNINYSSYKKYRGINKMLSGRQYFSHDEIARFLHCSKSTIQRAIKHKKAHPEYYRKKK
ncbi:MAG: HTH domain-containing protein [Promethearchaeia archaeon]